MENKRFESRDYDYEVLISKIVPESKIKNEANKFRIHNLKMTTPIVFKVS